MKRICKTKFLFFFLSFLILGNVFVIGVNAQTEAQSFYIESSYDLYARRSVEAILIRTSDNLYFYIEEPWWESRSSADQNDIRVSLYNLGEEFKNKIYPTLTSAFSSEWNPGIDNDSRITVLIHEMERGAGGYFRNHDEYYKPQIYSSNEREMVYLNTQYITTSFVKSFLAHEFVHLITFNQKDRLRNVTDDVWLNEARAEYAPTLLGYDDIYEGSNLQKRVKSFLDNPSVSLTEWKGEIESYGVLNVFVQYLIDHYGIKILQDSIFSSKIGIESVNYALQKNGFQTDFSQIFSDWSVAVLVNDCSLGSSYCYKNSNLKNLRITPETNFIPTSAESTLITYNQIKDWSAKWQKIFGGKGSLALKFNAGEGVNFKAPYVVCDFDNKCFVESLELDKDGKEEIFISDFSSKYFSLTIVPSVQEKETDFTISGPSYPFSLEIKTKEAAADNDVLIQSLLDQISYLQAEIARVQAAINAFLASQGKEQTNFSSCQSFGNNLYFGMRSNQEVSCLQEFLKSQGSSIYPEGLVTGNFFSLTFSAVQKYQAKKGIIQTGYFGPLTRIAVNSEL
ncbi:MAG: peptidoglycan-binding protein [Candidatus Pacebacteria bacterium]|nr:peptidoglycan-binding protein [Candidatus Paceibacterota bacterium]